MNINRRHRTRRHQELLFKGLDRRIEERRARLEETKRAGTWARIGFHACIIGSVCTYLILLAYMIGN